MTNESRTHDHDEFGSPIINGDSIRRESFTTHDGRIVGIEYVRHHTWQGRDTGYTWREEITDTRVFFLHEEAGAWRSELDARRQIVIRVLWGR